MERINRVLNKIFTQKPIQFVAAAGFYLLLVSLLTWKIHPDLRTALFVLGGILGIYFLDIVEEYVNLNPSPFNSPLFNYAYIVLSFFVVTSANSLFTAGLVLTIYLTLIFRQLNRAPKTVPGDVVSGPLPVKSFSGITILFLAVFIIENLLFIRSYSV